MPEGYLLMSASERERSHVIRLTIEKSLAQREAAERLGLSVRQFKRLVHAWKRDGDGGLVSRRHGRVALTVCPRQCGFGSRDCYARPIRISVRRWRRRSWRSVTGS